MNFRRYYIPGAAVFITQVVQYREPVFRDPKMVFLLREILRHVKELHPFSMLGYVFLPEHFHVIVQPTGESNFSDIMHSLKPNFTKEYKKMIGLSPSQSMKFWQKRFWDHVVRAGQQLYRVGKTWAVSVSIQMGGTEGYGLGGVGHVSNVTFYIDFT